MLAKGALFDLARSLEGLAVMGAMGHTPAAQAGIRYGDVLLSVNGERTRTFSDYLAAKALRADGMVAVVFRGGEEITVELIYNPTPRTDPLEVLVELLEMRVLPGDLEGEGPTS